MKIFSLPLPLPLPAMLKSNSKNKGHPFFIYYYLKSLSYIIATAFTLFLSFLNKSNQPAINRHSLF